MAKPIKLMMKFAKNNSVFYPFFFAEALLFLFLYQLNNQFRKFKVLKGENDIFSGNYYTFVIRLGLG